MEKSLDYYTVEKSLDYYTVEKSLDHYTTTQSDRRKAQKRTLAKAKKSFGVLNDNSATWSVRCIVSRCDQ